MHKPISPSSSTVTISVYDPAIDWVASPIADAELSKKYAEESIRNPSCFRDYVKPRAGEALTVYTIGAIPPDELVRIEDECRPGPDVREVGGVSVEVIPAPRNTEAAWRSFLLGVRDIEGWQARPEYHEVNGVRYVRPQWLKDNFGRGLRKIANDVGSRIWHWNQLTEDEIKN